MGLAFMSKLTNLSDSLIIFVSPAKICSPGHAVSINLVFSTLFSSTLAVLLALFEGIGFFLFDISSDLKTVFTFRLFGFFD